MNTPKTEQAGERTQPGIWDECSRTWIRPSGTVKQDRRPMWQPFPKEQNYRVQAPFGPERGENETLAGYLNRWSVIAAVRSPQTDGTADSCGNGQPQ